ncbi:hypothetical protein BJX96DRAFT_82418 [Aspergillus floccosus]
MPKPRRLLTGIRLEHPVDLNLSVEKYRVWWARYLGCQHVIERLKESMMSEAASEEVFRVSDSRNSRRSFRPAAPAIASPLSGTYQMMTMFQKLLAISSPTRHTPPGSTGDRRSGSIAPELSTEACFGKKKSQPWWIPNRSCPAWWDRELWTTHCKGEKVNKGRAGM